MSDTQQLSNYFPQSTLSCPVWVKHASLDQSPSPDNYLIGWVAIDTCWNNRGTYLKVQVELLKIVTGRKEKVLGKHKCN